MLALVRTGLPRQKAYEMVQRSALAARDGAGAFPDLLARDPDVSSRLAPEELRACFDLDHHLRWSDSILARALKEAE